MEWIVMECVETADCELEVSAAFVGEDVLICLKGGEKLIWDVWCRRNRECL